MDTFGHELFPTLFVNKGCHQVRKRTGLWVARSLRSNGVTLNHPAAAESQNGIESGTQRGHFAVRRGGHIRPAKGPSRQQSPVLEKENTVVHHRVVKEQVG